MGKLSTQAVVMTGHLEIDRQHLELDQLVQQLGTICEKRGISGSSCVECPAAHRESCTNRLAQLLGDLLGFVVTHFSYEETLMRELPSTAACRQHIEEHKLAHAEVSAKLLESTRQLDRENPKHGALRLQETILSWMGSHTGSLDVELATKLESIDTTELAHDLKLVKLLEQQPGAYLAAR